ncbi:Hapless 2, partial [Anthophora quadrimaculata]
MSPAVWHLLILWMTLVSYPRMSATSSPYVSGFDYVPRFHPSRNPDCPSRFVRDRQLNEDYDVWDRPSIEIRALLSGCSRFEEERTTREEFHIRRKRRYNEEEDSGRITNCTRKIFISMRFNNIGKTDIQEKFVVIDHALDSLTMKKIPLRNPYVIKVRQEPILQMYGLKFQSVVNAEAKEEVINNRNPNYKGCYTDSDRPTCGQSFVHGEPVPFSQGFCCSCDSRVNGERQNGGWNESSSGEAKSNNKDATNNFGNRLRTGNVSSDDNSMAPRQPEGKEIESKKKPNVSHVNLTYDQTIKTNVSIYNTFRDEDRHGKLSNEVPLENTYLNKEKEKQEKSQEPSKSVPSSLLKMNLINGEKYSKKQPDRSSTSRSSLPAEVTAGRMPKGDKMTSDNDVGRDRACGLGNEVSPRKTGCLMAVHRTPSPIKELNSKNTGSDTKNQICDGEVYKNPSKIEQNERRGSDGGFHSIDTKADVKKVSRVSDKEVATRSKNQLSRFEDPFRSMKHERERKLTSERRRKKVGKGNDENEARRNVYDERWPESFHGDKGPSVKSSKKRNKVFLAPVTIDSPSIRPSMHLNEPLKNSSTGVSNGNRSPAGRRWSSGGNLNEVMENTSESGEIIGGTFNEKHGRDGPLRRYVQSNGNEEGKRSRAATLNEKKKRGFQRTMSRKNDLSANKEMIKNYTPQKRTLKDVSYRNDEQRDSKRYKRHGVACHSRKKNFIRSRRHLRHKKNSLSRRRTRRFNEKHGRGSRKRSKKFEEDKGPSIRNPGHDVQVYIDNTKTLEERMSEKSRLSKFAHDEKTEMGRNSRKSNGKKDDSISRKEANRQDNVDKQIEEKFSRISDALKEDAMGSKTIMDEKKPDTADVDPSNNEREESSNDVAEVQNKLEELDTAPSYRKAEENRKANGNEVPGAIKINENIDDAVGNPPSYQADILDVNQEAYGNTQAGGKYEQAFANSQQNNPSNLNELINDYKTSTSNYDLAISPTIGSSASNEKNQLTSNVFTPENVDEIQLYGLNNPENVPINPVPSTTETNGQLTRAVIVVDFFKIPTDSLTTFRDIPEPAGTQPKLMDRLGGLKKNIEKALMKLKPVSRNTVITESTTMMLTEPTTKNTSLETTTSVGTTKITEPGFRVSIKPTENATEISPGGAEMHHEVIIDGLTFPDETTNSVPQTSSFLSLNSISEKLVTSKAKRKSWISDRRRKKRRTTPSLIKNEGFGHLYERQEDRNMYREDVPRDYEAKKRSTQPDSPIKFSLEARNVDVVKQRIGEGCSFSREQRNYLQVRVDDHGEVENNAGDKFAPRKYERFQLNEAKVRNENKDASNNVEKVRNSIADLKLLHRPWFATTAVSEYIVEPKSHSNHASSSKSTTNVDKSRKMKNEAIYGENSSSSTIGGVLGRILPPCTSDKHRSIENRGRKSVICEAETNPGGRRRLLSVQRLKDGKKVERRSSKDRKKILEDEEEEEEDNFVKDDGTDVEYEEDTSKHRKRLKPVRDKDQEKSNKRNAARLKRKKEKKEKKQLISSSDNLSGDYDYYIPGEQVEEDDRTILEQRGQPENYNNNPDDVPLEYYEADPTLGGLAGKEGNQGVKIAMDTQESNLNDQMIDNTDPVNDFDKFTSDVKSGNDDIQDGTDELAGKDFEISLTGKIHLESDSNGRPVSISFNAAPEFPRKDTIDDGKANGNRFPSESANSFIAASDTLVPAGTDNTNFLPNVFDVEPPPPPSMNVALDPLEDRSIAREYFLDTIRSRNKYRNEGNPRLMPLHLQKKSVDSAKDQATSSKQLSSKSFKRSLKRTKKDSGSSKSALDTNFGMEDAGEPKEDENSNIGDTNEDPLSSNQDDSKETSDEDVGDLPQLFLDMPNLPETSLLGDDFGNKDNYTKIGDSSRDSNSGPCFALNTTTQKIILPETTTTMSDTYLGAVAETTVLSFHDFAVGEDSNSTEVETAPPTTTTVSTIETTTTTSSNNDTVVEAKLSYPKIEAAMGITKNLTELNPIENIGNYTGENSKESIEKKNMLAVSEFVKKLEKLVADGNSTNNNTGRTLIHLKKFIIVPDNRTLWSLKKYVKPEDIQDTGSTETIIVMGEGTHDKVAKQPLEKDRDLEDQEYSEVEDEEKSRADPNLIKQIISSVIRGEDLKRNADPPKSFDAPSDSKTSEFKDWANPEVEKSTKDLAKAQEETSMKGDGCLQSVQKNIGEPILETSLENEKKSSKKDNDVCTDCKSNAKAKREATAVNARSVDGKRQRKDHGKKKEAKHPKKKRRKKRKRKIKKRKGGGGKRTSKKAKSKWPFKRNLLMLSEEDQIQPSNVEDGTKLRLSRDQSLMRKNDRRRKKVRPARMANEENKPKEPQIRGGQDCSDHRHPAGVDPLKYLESAHCLRFSDLWYSVYRLEEPVVVHKVHLQIYVKQTSPDGSTIWKDLTNGSTIRLGTFDKHYRNKERTMSLTYTDVKVTSHTRYSLDPGNDRLLIPSSTLPGKRSKYSEAEGWSSEYLVVQADKINEDASKCDKAGVGFTAFVNQPDRCERVSGTCLRNQPMDYWRHDVEARKSGRAGCYFLSNFARVPSEAIKYNVNGNGSREFLALEYHSPHVSVIDVELADDYNALLRAGSSGRLTEVHVDNTAIDYTVITVLITNKGSSSSSYRARITDCPKGLPVSWLNAESATKTISPHRDRKVALDLYGRLSLNEFSCSVVLLNRYGEPIARREIKVQKMDRCVCMRHCVCSCMSNLHDDTTCRPMLLEHYHDAGFRGPLPVPPTKPSIWSSILTIVCLVLTILLLLLLLLGFFKWLIGICVPAVGRWGLDDLVESDKMTEYYEKDLKSKSVVFDQFGQPVHPETGGRSIRVCSRKLEFFLNLTFFFLHPFVICCLCFKKPRRPGTSSSSVVSKVKQNKKRKKAKEEKASLMSEKGECPAMICVSTYGDAINSKMEAEDTKYVIDELKKSQESLQNHSRYKRKQILQEHSSSD